MTNEELFELRDRVAAEHGIAVARRYNMAQTAHFLGVDESTIKRWRKKGLVRANKLGPKLVYFLGVQIVDFIIHGVDEEWESTSEETFKSALGISASEREAPLFTAAATTPPPALPNASAYITQTMRPQKKP